jgi:hypothetical protein
MSTAQGYKAESFGHSTEQMVSTTQYKRSQHTGGSSCSFTASRTSMAVEALRS